MDPIDKLNVQWQQLWQFRSISVLDRQQIDRPFQLLVSAYTQPDRHYHNIVYNIEYSGQGNQPL
jgi:predicted metal-dependent HD superfamily phosphohydrolase